MPDAGEWWRGARLLLLLPQLPHDPASGAAHSMRTLCEMLAGAGFHVRVLATTAMEGDARPDLASVLNRFAPAVDGVSAAGGEIAFSSRRAQYRLLDVGDAAATAWEDTWGRAFDDLFDEEIAAFRPDFLLGFGGQPGQAARYGRAQRLGARVVFGLRNSSYLKAAEFLRRMDALLTPSRFLSEVYRAKTGLDSTALPPPLDLDEVVAEEHDPVFVTMVNPSPEKGLMFFARLAEELSRRRPDIPILAVESRGSGQMLAQAAWRGGFDLCRHENLLISPPVAFPREIYRSTRVLLVPSLWPEPAGRVAAEALLNGIPPICSGRGGLLEQCNGGGLCLAIPDEITMHSACPVEPRVVGPWVDAITRLADDDDFYSLECERAREAGQIHRPESLLPRYIRFFRGVLDWESRAAQASHDA
jgi:hypothetical protein